MSYPGASGRELALDDVGSYQSVRGTARLSSGGEQRTLFSDGVHGGYGNAISMSWHLVLVTALTLGMRADVERHDREIDYAEVVGPVHF